MMVAFGKQLKLLRTRAGWTGRSSGSGWGTPGSRSPRSSRETDPAARVHRQGGPGA
ncbi:hypothetical protein NKH18_43825 [Streptomyces sp. M10(2022)]